MTTTDTTNIDNMVTTRAYKKLIDELREKMENGDELATRCVGAMALLISGWRYGDPDPEDDGPDDDGEPGEVWDAHDAVILFRRAA